MTASGSELTSRRISPVWRWTLIVTVVFLALIGAATVRQYLRYSQATRLVDHAYRVLATLDALRSSLLDAETGTRGFLLTARPEFLTPFTDAGPRVETHSSALLELVEDNPSQLAHAAEAARLSRVRMEELQAAVTDFQSGQTAPAIARIGSGVGRRLMDEIRGHLDTMGAAENALLGQRAAAAQVARQAALIFAGICFALAGGVGFAAVAVGRDVERRRLALERERANRENAEHVARASAQELQRSESLTRSILDNSGDCIQIVDPQGRLVSTNRSGLRLMGIADPAAVEGKPWAELWDQTSRLAEDAITAATTHGEGRFQGQSLTAGKPRWWDVLVTPLRDEQGRVVSLVCVARDISDQQRIEQERERLLANERAARAEAERAAHMKDEFLATLSHELRTPLNAIVGWIGVLKQDRSGETLSKAVDVIDRNSRRQSQMIDDLLDVSRIISGKLPLEIRRMELGGVVEEALSSVEPAAAAKGIRLIKVLGSAAAIQGDPARLQQIIWNLVSNAIKFTGRGGLVHVSLRKVESHVQLEVGDTGQGIAPEMLPIIFQRFRQADSSSSRRHGGLGLGLAIVKNLVEMHGGSVEATSAGINQGALFIVRLPIAPVTGVDAGATTAGDAAVRYGVTLTGVTAMVVDDEEDARELVERLLSDAGARVTVWSNAKDALQAIVKGYAPDVIISDVGMPDQDGYEFMQHVRQLNSPISAVPAAALTALARVEDRKRALLAGYQTHVAKPVDPGELVATVASLARRTGRTA